MSEYRLSRGARLGWAVALAALPVVGISAVFGMTDDGLVPGEGSALAQRYAVTPATATSTPAEEVLPLPSRFGRPDGATALVLYDASGDRVVDAELYAVAAANLATHFGQVEVAAVGEYTGGAMDRFDAVVYLGTDFAATLPRAFLDDVRQGDVPVLWASANIEELAGTEATAAAFVDRYGWDPRALTAVRSSLVETLRYKDSDVHRLPESTGVLLTPRVLDAARVEVLAEAVCATDRRAVSCDGSPEGPTEAPWAVRSKNLTYLAELPLNYIDENDVYLVLADLYYDLLGPDIEPVRQAAVRLEDVGPEASPAQLRAVADYLHAEGVPFQVAVMPIHIARTPDQEGWYGLSLLDTPDVVAALKYMQERGGTLIQHGTTHQFGASDNPYSGRTGEDYEFFRYGCSDTAAAPYRFTEECRQDSYVREVGPVEEDSIEQHVTRIEHGRQVMIDAGLGAPTIFETPHYAGSVNAYLAMAQVYDARYEGSQYYAGLLSGGEVVPEYGYGQHFPYTVHDIYGSTVYPENLRNITEVEQNHHGIRDPQYVIDRAEAHLVVRESTASFYFHPYLDLDYLKETVRGIQELGYTFVPVDELR